MTASTAILSLNPDLPHLSRKCVKDHKKEMPCE